MFKKVKKEKKKILLSWYPKDFTFVRTNELHFFQKDLNVFLKQKYNCYGESSDSAEVRFAWLNYPKSNGGVEGANYDLITDTN